MPRKIRPETSLIFADSERNADLLYATRFFAPDAFLFLKQDGKTTILLSDLEIDRGKRAARVDEVASYSSISEPLKKKLKREPSQEEVLVSFLKQRKVRSATVPADFPLGLAIALQQHGIGLTPCEGMLFPEREFKSANEITEITAILRITEIGMERAFEVLKAAKTGRSNRLTWNGKPLTSEILRGEIDAAIIRAGGLPANTIVAGGEQACDPHERGCGPLFANQLIILDIFPRHSRSGYYGDLTRTVVRGKASEAQRRLWDIVLQGQTMALKEILPGVDGLSLHEKVKNFFRDQGYPTEQVNGRWQGFFHGTGHALGLELHEAPRIARTKFTPGQVFTVEPGLYFPGTGGVRHEDVVVVTEKGVKLLTRCSKPLELS